MCSNNLPIQLHDIVNHLIEGNCANIIIRQWRTFYHDLETPSPNFQQWERSYNNCCIETYELFHKILQHWVSEKQTEATTTELERILRKGKFNASAEIVSKLGDKQIKSNVIRKPKATQIWFEVGKSTTNFVGRESQIQKLKTFYQEQKRNLVVVSGFSGVGKTEIVKKFASIFYEEFNGHCIWLQGDTEDGFNKSIKRFCERINVKYSETDLAANVQSIFSTLQSDQILIIIDNVDKENNQVSSFIRLCHTLKMTLPFFVVTSREKTVLNASGNNIEMETLGPNEAQQLVRDSLDFETNDDDVIKLCEELHNFPLLLQQAVGFIKNERLAYSEIFNVAEYLSLLETKKKELYDHPLSVDHTYSSTTITAWNMTLENIRQRNELVGASAIFLLRMLAYLNPEGEGLFSLAKFYKDFDNNISTAKEVESLTSDGVDLIEKEIRLLQSYSLCKVDDSYRRKVSVHRLVAEVVGLTWSIGEKINFLDKALSNRSSCRSTIIQNSGRTFLNEMNSDLLYGKYFPSIAITNKLKNLDVDTKKIILIKAANCFGWTNQIVLDFEFEILHALKRCPYDYRENSPTDASKYCLMFLNTYERLKRNFGIDHENTERVLHVIDVYGEAAYYILVDINIFTNSEFLALVELLADLINFDKWSWELNYLSISIMKSSCLTKYLDEFREIVNTIVKHIPENNKNRLQFLWTLKLISIEFKKLKLLEDFKSIEEIISDSLMHPSEKVLFEIITYDLFQYEVSYFNLFLCQYLIRNQDFSLLKSLFKFDLNNVHFQEMLNKINQNKPDVAFEFIKLELKALEMLLVKGKCSFYDVVCITSKLKSSFTQAASLVEKWELENLKLKDRHNSVVLNKIIALTNKTDREISNDLIKENEKFKETSEWEDGFEYPIEYQNGRFIWLIEVRIFYLYEYKLEQTIHKLRNEEAKSILEETIVSIFELVSIEKGEVSRDEAFWIVKELCGFLYFREQDKFVVDWLVNIVIPSCLNESELNLIKQLLNQIAFHICQKLDKCYVDDSFKLRHGKYDIIKLFCGRCKMHGLGDIRETIDSAIEIFVALFKYEFHFPLFKAIVQTLTEMEEMNKIVKLKKMLTEISTNEERDSLKEEINIALGVINNAKPKLDICTDNISIA